MTSKPDLFAGIRITSRKAGKGGSSVKAVSETRPCDYPGCKKAGTNRAPKGRGAEGQFWNFCVEHVREYNASYNYFNGMNDQSVAEFHKDASTGHRPTWSLGTGAQQRAQGGAATSWGHVDPLGLLGEQAGVGAASTQRTQKRHFPPLVRAAFETLDVEDNATPQAIKSKFKVLVKKFHPDANGGDRNFEIRLQEIIRAYNTLKSAGLAS
jgi:hypothetical protein